MKKTLIIADDFAPEPMLLRERVLASAFGDQVGPDGETYTGISVHQEPGLIDLITRLLERPIKPKMAFWRMNMAYETPHCFCHADTICAEWASILYLNLPEQCHGGTAFWRHNILRIDAMPTAEEARQWGEPSEVAKRIGYDWQNPSLWEQVGFVGMKFNRFVTYPTKLFHSRWPQTGFGTSKETGRLIHVSFYD